MSVKTRNIPIVVITVDSNVVCKGTEMVFRAGVQDAGASPSWQWYINSIPAVAIVRVAREFAMPSAFTPNGDGHNDVFRIPPGVSLELTSFSIYNRWGQPVFITTRIDQGWDGTWKGKKLDMGTYVYVIEGKNSKGAVLLKGSLQLVR